MKITILLFFVTTIISQTNYRKELITMEDGLSSNAISTLYQDSRGFLWIGTDGGGINIYDGYKFTSYNHNPFESTSISSNYITSITEDSKGVIWIGTHSGLNTFHPESETFERKRFKSASTQIEKHMFYKKSLFFLASGNLFMNIGEDSIKKINTHFRVNSFDINQTSDIIYLATTDGVKKYSIQQDSITHLPLSLSSTYIVDVLCRDSISLVSTAKHIYQVKNQSVLKSYSKKRIKLSSSNGNVFLLDKKELYGLDKNASLLRIISNLNLKRFTTVYQTSDDIVWLGSDEKGLFKYSPVKNGIETITDTVNYPVISILPVDKKTTWLGTPKGIMELGSRDKISSMNISKYAYQLEKDKANNLWLWSKGSLEKYNEKTKQFEIQTIIEGNKRIFPSNINFDSGDVFAIADTIIYRYYSKQNKFVPFRMFPKILRAKKIKTFKRINNTYWIIASDGIYSYDKMTQNSVKTNFSGTNITYNNLFNFGDNNLWFISDFGLLRHNYVTKTHKFYTKQHGLSDNRIKSIHKFNGLWITSEYGLSHLILQNDSIKSISKYYESDGLSSNHFTNAFIKDGNRLIAGTKNGLTVIYPKALNKNTHFNKVQPGLISFKSSKLVVDHTKPIELSYEENTIKIEYSSFNFDEIQKQEYHIRIIGLWDDWRSNSSYNKLHLANIDPGEYVFDLKAADKSGHWSNQIFSIPFTINPPFWDTWWFYFSVSLVIILITYYLYYLRERSRKDIEKLRIKIATDLHDDVGANLTKIALYSESMHKLSEKSVYPTPDKLNRVKELSRKSIDSMSDIVWAIDTRNNKVRDLLNKVDDFFHDVNTKMNFNVNFNHYNIDPENNIKMDVRKNIFLIIKEFVTNAIKYSKCDTIFVTIQNDESFSLEIWDNGKPSKSEKKTGNGLKNIKMRAKEINYDLTIDTEDGYKLILKGAIL